jgi:hypothetical protein
VIATAARTASEIVDTPFFIEIVPKPCCHARRQKQRKGHPDEFRVASHFRE